MFEKYVVKKDNQTVVLKYDLRTDTVTVGGFAVFSELIELVVEDGFDQEMPLENTHSQRNKIKYIFKCARKKYRSAIKYLDENFILEKVESHGRLI